MMRYLSLLDMVAWCFIIFVVLVATVRVHGQPSTEGFISIDCGLADGNSYIDDLTNIPYSSDAQYIETGTNHNISGDYMSSSLPEHQTSLRSFPTGERNCYALKSLEQGQKYLLRATFMYGNYDGQQSARDDKPIQFDLHIGVNRWKSIKIVDASAIITTEAITVALADYISVCLINKQSGTPFISSLELRPLKTNLYPAANASISLVLVKRFDMGPTDGLVRYPDDGHDCIWQAFGYVSSQKEISTKSTVQISPDDPFEAPSAVLQTALTPVIGSEMRFRWDTKREDITPEYHIIMHFAEIQSLGPNDSRTFDIYLNGEMFLDDSYTPQYLQSGYAYTSVPYTEYEYDLSFEATNDSTLPPIINGLEIYAVMQLPELSTDSGDVGAIMAIKMEYQVKKRNWMGDPCAPRAYAWDGLNCRYIVSVPPRIKTLNLSSSGLSGAISRSFAKLNAIETLDLSYNNFTGTIPGFLADISSLQLLDLRGNQLTGPVPAALLRKSEKGLLTLRIDGPNPCINESACGNDHNNNNKKKKITTPIIVIISIGAVVLLLVVVLIVWITRRRQQDFAMDPSARARGEDYDERKVDCEDHQLKLESRQFTYKDLVNITNKFVRIIGKGGFGIVYHGFLENGVEVAVKLWSQSSSQGTKEFLAEAQSLTRVHHKNLVIFVGYCKEENYLALVYEYMSEGSLQEHLRGKAGLGRILSWGERLRIAVQAAQGLEYLHKGCTPPIIHRDVKTSNILLGEELVAKIADFGLSKSFHSDAHSHVSTEMVVGTPGYVDPAYHYSYQLNEKSDVFSFGVVLLELITGHPPIMPGPGKAHIVQWVASKLASGNIEDAVDARLQGEYDTNSVWKIVDLAMKCTARFSTQRPTMSDVVIQLKESLALEAAWERTESLHGEGLDISQNGAFELDRSKSMSIGPSAR